MVISLESQNVKGKRSVYRPVKRFNSVKINKIKLKTPDISIGLRHIPHFVGFFVFLFLFSQGHSYFIPKNSITIDLNSIILPDHRADISVKNLIEGYEIAVNDKYFTKVRIYSGETLSSISIKYGVSRDTLLQVNDITDIRNFSNLETLIIPISDGYNHKVSPKDTLESLEAYYNVSKNEIFRVNDLKSENISGFETIFIPGINPVDWGWKSNIDRFFIYPLNGFITQRYGFFTNSITGITSLYEGIDIAPSEDLSVYASKAGYISRIGFSPNYGHYLYIDHQGGTRTLYAHMENIEVKQFENVKQGEIIGIVGKSGFTNTTKLFFSIFNRDESVDPEEYLK